MGRNRVDVTKAMLAEQAAATGDVVVDGDIHRNPGEGDFDSLVRTGKPISLADVMAKEAGEINLDDPVLDPPNSGEANGDGCLHCLVGEPIAGMPDYFWPVVGDPHPAGVRHCPDGRGRFWFDKVLVNIAGKSEAVYKYDRVNSEKQLEEL